MEPISPLFLTLPEDIQKDSLDLIDRVNRQHLHCAPGPSWDEAKHSITYVIAVQYLNKDKEKPKSKKIQQRLQQVMPPPAKDKKRMVDTICQVDGQEYTKMFDTLRQNLNQTFQDPDFVDVIIEETQKQFGKQKNNAELLSWILQWITQNGPYLPLGVHLLPAFQKDAMGVSNFFQRILSGGDLKPIPEAQSKETLKAMRAFLSVVSAANDSSLEGIQANPGEEPSIVIISVKNGAGGHTAPSNAMEARLKELGHRVVKLHYDTDLNNEYDPFLALGITFEDGEPMTQHLFSSRWLVQKQNKVVAKIIQAYVSSKFTLNPTLFKNYSGAEFIRKKIIPLNPKLIITTCAYHWTWRSIAYRLAQVKTLIVCSDVFFHSEAMTSWTRQLDIDPALRNVHFTTMTDDLALLKSKGIAHDEYWKKKFPGRPLEDSWVSKFEDLVLDKQITYIGAPIDPSFDINPDETEIQRIRKKWEVPEDAVVACISRGKYGFTADLLEAVEGYRTKDYLSQPLHLHVVCGENQDFYKRLCSGEFNDLAPNITLIPHGLLRHQPLAELRAISIVDDIKAGGASTFEGWYLISKGVRSKLLLTPGPKLWWEMCNCWAMEKWGVGTLTEGKSKIEIIEDIIANGLEPIKNKFPDWKIPFDKIIKELYLR